MASSTDDKRLQKKRLLYASISAVEDDDDETPDHGLLASLTALRGKGNGLNRANRKASREESNIVPSTHPLEDASRTLSRSVSDASALAPATGQQLPPRLARTSPVNRLIGNRSAVLRTRQTFSGALPSSSDIPQATGKRKRNSELKIMPPEHQIFRDLHFYFFPNSEKNPARHMRITKAIEFGAYWHRDWHKDVTHIITDKLMDYDKLLKYLNLKELPANVTLVDESWPSDCIASRTILDTTQPQFKVRGAPIKSNQPKVKDAVPPPSSANSATSLKLKPPGKAVKARRSETPLSQDTSIVQHSSETSEALQEANVPEDDDTIYVPSTDELEAAIGRARALQEMPLDDDDDAEGRPSSSNGQVHHHDVTSDPQTDPQIGRKRQTFQDKFQCMQKHTGDNANNPNAATISILQQMADYYGQIGDEWRIRAYRKAIATLRNHPTKVSTKEEAQGLANIGERLATKIEEIVFTSRLRRLDNARAEPSDQILRTFMDVYGAGFVQASQWVRQGYTTLDELLEKATLTDNQRIGIEHFEDFRTRIPRTEVEQLGGIVRKELHKIDATFEVIIGGSYRRGASSSGDVDCIVTRPDTGAEHLRSVVLNQLVPKLFAKRFLMVGLAVTSRDDGSKWHGACCLPGSKIWRRIDLLLVPSAELGAGLLYFTGNDIFSRSIRLLASTKGMRLNQRGLYKNVMRGRDRQKIAEGTLVEGKDERKIFEALGVPWRPPEHRIP